MFKQGVPRSNSCHYLIPLKDHSALLFCSILLTWCWGMSYLWCALWACSSGLSKSLSPVETLILNESQSCDYYGGGFPPLLSSFPSSVSIISACVMQERSKSLQPHCEMMSQIHKTLTSPFQLLFIIYHPYFIFLWEDLYVRVLCVHVSVFLSLYVSLWVCSSRCRVCTLEDNKPLGLFQISKLGIFASHLALHWSYSIKVIFFSHYFSCLWL